MRYESEHAAETRQRIIRVASRLFRERGVHGASVASIMEAAGLTVGGFYRHFESKEALLQEALGQALKRTHTLLDSTDVEGEAAWLDLLSWVYLTPEHRDNLAQGCPLPALCGEIAREDAGTRAVFEAELLKLASSIEARLTGEPGARSARAWRVLAMLVGGLLLARSVADDGLSREILAACQRGFTPGRAAGDAGGHSGQLGGDTPRCRSCGCAVTEESGSIYGGVSV